MLAAALLGAWWWLRSSLPPEAGELAVGGISGEVRIARDTNGVPHITAGDLADALYGLGFAHAQDRLWQMEFQRRLGAGRLSEIFGARTLELDRNLRTIGFAQLAARAAERLDPEARRLLDSYVAGVNAYLSTRRGALPLEFLLTDSRPEPWTAADSLVWLYMMGWTLSTNMEEEMLRARVLARFDQARLDEMFPDYPSRALAPVGPAIQALQTLYRGLDWRGAARLAGALPAAPAASNNWVVDGRRSASGKPMLANDPHLSLTAPGIWYLARLSVPGLELVGGTLPGLPGVVIGHNGQLAWGLTNLMADVQDLYVEKLIPGDPRRYLTPDGPQPFATRTETIKVHGAADVDIAIRSTRHGPVISDVHPRAAQAAPEGHVISLAWMPAQIEDRTLSGLLALNQARNVAGAREAGRRIGVVALNLLTADSEGRIAYQAVGAVPQRQPDNPLQGTLPNPGWEAVYDWIGAIAYEDLPQALDPPGGMLATANHKVVDDDYPHRLSNSWLPGYRIRRIEEVLRATPRHNAGSFAALQMDARSLHATDLLPRLTRIEPTGAAAHRAIELLRRWDGTMAAERPEPLIFAAWYREILRVVLSDELGDLYEPFVEPPVFGMRFLFMQRVLESEAGWCDDRRTTETETCNQALERALDAALERLAARHGDDMSAWRWGEAHRAVWRHQALADMPLLGAWLSPGGPAPGEAETVNASPFATLPGQPFDSSYGPGLRMIVDLANPPAALFIAPPGQSGNPLSRHYRDMHAPWQAGDHIDIPPLPAGGPALLLRPAGS